jgi:hypothetical protein
MPKLDTGKMKVMRANEARALVNTNEVTTVHRLGSATSANIRDLVTANDNTKAAYRRDLPKDEAVVSIAADRREPVLYAKSKAIVRTAATVASESGRVPADRPEFAPSVELSTVIKRIATRGMISLLHICIMILLVICGRWCGSS